MIDLLLLIVDQSQLAVDPRPKASRQSKPASPPHRDLSCTFAALAIHAEHRRKSEALAPDPTAKKKSVLTNGAHQRLSLRPSPSSDPRGADQVKPNSSRR